MILIKRIMIVDENNKITQKELDATVPESFVETVIKTLRELHNATAIYIDSREINVR